jgi:hypothetical protein
MCIEKDRAIWRHHRDIAVLQSFLTRNDTNRGFTLHGVGSSEVTLILPLRVSEIYCEQFDLSYLSLFSVLSSCFFFPFGDIGFWEVVRATDKKQEQWMI